MLTEVKAHYAGFPKVLEAIENMGFFFRDPLPPELLRLLKEKMLDKSEEPGAAKTRTPRKNF